MNRLNNTCELVISSAPTKSANSFDNLIGFDNLFCFPDSIL